MFNELKRRNVFRVAVAYIIVAWLVMQVAEVMAPALRLPDWAISFVAFVLILGFPVAMVLAWAFEITPEGLRKERDVVREESITDLTGRKLNRLIVGLLVVAVAYIAWDTFLRTGGEGTAGPTDAASLVVDQKSEGNAGKEATDTPDTADDKSIAVLPFQNRSANEENAAFFADGVHDELLTNLSKIGDLKVISRTSVMRYRDTEKSMRAIGDELGVATLLEGGVQRAGDQLRVNVQLIDADTDEHLWAESYDRELTAENVFAIQSDIALAIAEALEAALSPQQRAELERIPTSSLEAYDLYLLASQLRDHANFESLEQALGHVERATALDPEFQQAFVMEARILTELYNTGARTLEAVRHPLEAAIDRALALDPESGSAHAARAAYLELIDAPGAVDEFEKALRLAPNDTDVLADFARNRMRASDPERALELIQRARELDPLSLNLLMYEARSWEALGELDRTIDTYARIREIDPSSNLGKGPVTGPYVLQGLISRALYWLHEGWKTDPADLDLPNWIVRAYMDLGDFESARAWLESIVDANPEFPFTLASAAVLAMETGAPDEAVRMATRHLAAGLNNRWGSESMAVDVLLIDAVRSNDPGPALELLEEQRPELFGSPPEINALNILTAVNGAQLMRLDGNEEQAQALLRAVVDFADQPYALTGSVNAWRVGAKARALALLGEEQVSLEELHKQVDSGWRVLWRWQIGHSPNFDSLRGEPAFRELVEGLESDMRRQLREARAMEARGEIPSPPGRSP